MPRFGCGLCRLPSKLRRRARRSRILTMILILAVIAILLTPLYMIYKPPSLLISYFERRWPDVLWRVHVPSGHKIVALTIDDAPSEHTAEILQVLAENEASATFFVIGGQVAGREDVLREILMSGKGENELGNHAMRDEASRALEDEELTNQIGAVERKIRSAYDDVGRAYPPRYFRPGSGFFSDRMRGLMEGLSYRIVLGSVYPHDPQIPHASVNARHVLSKVTPGGIIICHDRRGWTVPMLRKVLPELRRRGYQIVTVTRLLESAAVEEG